MKKLIVFVLILIVALLVLVFAMTRNNQVALAPNQDQQLMNTGSCSSDADCPDTNECFGDQINRCVDSYPPTGEKSCRCAYPNCDSDADCGDGYICTEQEGDYYGKHCVWNEFGPDDGLDTSSDRGEALFDAVEIKAYVQEQAKTTDTVLKNCQGDVLVTQREDYDWQVICTMDSGSLNLILGSYGDIVDYSFEQ